MKTRRRAALRPRRLSREQLEMELKELRRRLAEAEQILEAIADDHVDALVINTRRTGDAEVLTIGGAHVAYAHFFETMAEAALTVDESGVILHTNRRMSQLAGRDDLVGSSLFSLLGNAGALRTLLQNVGGRGGQLESVLKPAGGAGLPVRVSANVLPVPGPRRIALLVSLHDGGDDDDDRLSAARPSQPYESVLEHLPTGAVVVDAHTGNITYANRRAEEILGRRLANVERPVSHVELTCWRPDGTIVEPEQLPFARVLRGEIVSRVELMRSRDDGPFVHTRSTAVPINDDDGEIASVLLAIEDMTEENKARAEREESERVRELFVAMLGHDLREPLSAIVGGASLIKRRATLDANDGKVMQRVETAAQRMARMIEQLLDFARSRARGIPIQPRDASLEQVVRTVVESVEAAQTGRAIELTIAGPVTGQWDPDRLEQLVSNLVSNALTHGDPCEPVRVDVRGDERRVTLSVHNRGNPIPPATVPFLFDPFRRGAAKSKSKSGLGLGLYIAQQIVHAHDGTITVESNDAGTRFTVSLPRSST